MFQVKFRRYKCAWHEFEAKFRVDKVRAPFYNKCLDLVVSSGVFEWSHSPQWTSVQIRVMKQENISNSFISDQIQKCLRSKPELCKNCFLVLWIVAQSFFFFSFFFSPEKDITERKIRNYAQYNCENLNFFSFRAESFDARPREGLLEPDPAIDKRKRRGRRLEPVRRLAGFVRRVLAPVRVPSFGAGAQGEEVVGSGPVPFHGQAKKRRHPGGRDVPARKQVRE